MALDPNTVDVMHPGTGEIITMPLAMAQQVGVTPDMIVPRAGDVQRTITEDPGAPPPQAPPPPPTQAPGPPPSQGGSAGIAGLQNANNSAKSTLGLLHLGAGDGTGMVGDEIAAPAAPDGTPQSVTGGALQAAQPQSAPQMPGALPVANSPDQVIGSAAPLTPKQVAASNKAYDTQQAAAQQASQKAAFAGGEAGVYNDHAKAAVLGEEAGKQVADTHSTYYDAMGKAYAERNAVNDKLAQQKADDAAKQLAAINLKNTQIDTAITALGNQKIDRTVDHPIMAALSAVIGMFGQAATGSATNGALDMLVKQIQRKTDAQMQDRQNAVAQVGLQRDQVAGLRQHLTDSSAMYDGLMAANTQKAINIGDALMARSNSADAQANWQAKKGEIQDKLADYKSGAMDKQNARDNADRSFAEQQKEHRDSIGVQYAGLAQQKKSLDEQIREHDLQRQDKLDEIAQQDRRLGAKTNAERAKEVATTGVFDPTSGAAVLTPDGQKIIDQADKLEIAARKMPPAQQAAAIAQAKNLRDQAETVGGFTIADKDIRKDVIKKVGASQDMINTIDDIKATLATDPSSIDRTTWAALETKYETAKAAFIEAHGAKMSSREMDAVHDMFGASPADMSTRLGGRGKMLARLDALEQGAIGGTTTELHANGYKGAWTPRHVGGDAPEVLSGATSVERGDDAQKGWVGKQLPDADLKFRSNEARQRQAENSGPITPTGLSPQDTSVVQQLARKYDKANDSDRDKIRSQLQAYASSSRPGLAQGVVTLVNAENPALYKEIAASTPNAARIAGDGSAIQAANDRVAQNQVLASTPIDNLLQAAAAGDDASKTEIIRRAANPAKPDPQARAALNQLIQAKR